MMQAKHVLVRAGQALLLALALPMAMLAAFAGFVGAGLATGELAVAAGGAAAACAAVAFAWSAWRGTRLGLQGRRRWRTAGAFSVVSLALTAGLAWQVFGSGPPEPTVAADRGAPMARIRLQTGSDVAYTHVPASGIRRGVVIYLHGGPAVPPRGQPERFLAPLADAGFEVVAYDQFGSGQSSRSDRITNYTLARQVEDLEALRVALGSERLVLVGSSWGAVLAGYYMAAHPARVERAMLLSPGVLTDRASHPYDYRRSASSDDSRVLLPPPRMILAGLLARIDPDFATAFASQDEMGRLFDVMTTGSALEYPAHCKGRFGDGAPNERTRRTGGNYYANLMLQRSLRAAPDPRPALRALRAPVLLIRGDCDYVPMSSLLAWRDALPDATTIDVPDAGHALTSDAPAVVVRAMLEHLGRQRPSTPRRRR